MLLLKLEYEREGQGRSDLQTSKRLGLIYERDGEAEKSTYDG